MKIINLVQGSAEWKAHRLKSRNASEANAVMGTDKNMTRSELLHQKATGEFKPVSESAQFIFDKGHRVEALARPIAEEEYGINQELYPCTGISDDGFYSASFDGLTMDRRIVWECKQWNLELAEYIREHNAPPPSHIWQVVQQLEVSGAEKCLFTVTDGTEDRLTACWVYPDAEKAEQLRLGWLQFDKDVQAYKAPEKTVQAVGADPGSLPALIIEVSGAVTASNLNEYRDRALAVFDGINRELSTDQDFADAKSTVKWCREVEDKLKNAKAAALAQTQSIDQLFSTIDELAEQARIVRLDLDKLVKQREKAIRQEIEKEARDSFTQHLAGLSETLGVPVPAESPDIAGAMKGKRTIETLRNAADTAAASAKIAASALAERMRGNLLAIDAHGRPELFPDLPELATKAPDDLAAIIEQRINQADEQARQRAEAEAKRKAEREAVEAARAEQAANKPAPEPQAERPKPAAVPKAEPPAEVYPSPAELVQVIASHYQVDAHRARQYIANAFFDNPKAVNQ